MTLSVRVRSACSLFALAVSAAPLFAQTPKAGTVEVNAGVRVSDVGIKNYSSVTSPTGLLGLYLHRNFAVEAEISSANGRVTNVPVGTRTTSSYTPIHLRGVFSIPVQEQVELLLGVGAVRNEQRWGEPNLAPVGSNQLQTVKKFNEYSWATMIGARLGLTDHVAFRAAVTVDGSQFDAGTNRLFDGKRSTNIGGNFGVSYLFNTKAKDADGDLVADKMDKCPNTPAGVKVDATGCPLDSDRDGVADYMDKCANTPAGVTVDSTGCPVDSDKDGVADFQDKCPNTPAGVKVDATGCPVDSDMDGVADFRDKCPNTPRGDKVNADGCSLPKDDDGDGVMNDADKCPGTPAGTKVDATGCPLPPPAAVRDRMVLEGVNFNTNSAVLGATARKLLLALAQQLKDNPDVRVEIGGHTDSTGSLRLNTRLSARRAASVRTFLITRGRIAASRLTSKGYGPSEPRADNGTKDGRLKNRRVETKPIQ